MSSKVSIVIPTLNQAPFLRATLESLLPSRPRGDLEVLLMDGGSTDGSQSIIDEFSNELAVTRSHKDNGQASAINEGLAQATGSIFGWLNSDDMHLPSTLSRVQRAFEDPRVDMIYGSSLIFRENGSTPQAFASPVPDFVKAELTWHDFMIQPSVFWRASLWERVGPLRIDMSFAFDWEWWLRAAELTTPIPVPEILSMYRLHPEHKSGTGSSQRRSEITQLVLSNAPQRWGTLYAGVSAGLQRHDEFISSLRSSGTPLRSVAPRLLALELSKPWARIAVRRPNDFRLVLRTLW